MYLTLNFVSLYLVCFASPFQDLPKHVWIPSITMAEPGETEPTAGDDISEEDTDDCIEQGEATGEQADNRRTAGGVKSDNEESTASGVKSDNEQSRARARRPRKKKEQKEKNIPRSKWRFGLYRCLL